MGQLTAVEIAPFVLFSLPTGVWLDRLRKLPIYVIGELSIALTVATVPCAWWFGWLGMPWLYLTAFVIGSVNTTAGSAAQIVLTQIVPRARLVEAHAKNALASSTAEVAGPGAAGALIKLAGAPLALLADAALLLTSASILRGVRVTEMPSARNAPFWPAMRAGLQFVRGHKLLVTMAGCVGVWQMCNQAAMVVQILFATRELGLSERGVGLSYVGLGAGTIGASMIGNRVVRRLGSGRTLTLGFTITGTGWLLLAVAPLDCRVRCDAAAFRPGRRVHHDQLPGVAPIGDAGAAARSHDQHDALVDSAAFSPGRAAGRLVRSALGIALVFGIRRRHRVAARARRFPSRRDHEREGVADAAGRGDRTVFGRWRVELMEVRISW